MYIPPFWAGFVVGIIGTIVGIITWTIWYSKKDK